MKNGSCSVASHQSRFCFGKVWIPQLQERDKERNVIYFLNCYQTRNRKSHPSLWYGIAALRPILFLYLLLVLNLFWTMAILWLYLSDLESALPTCCAASLVWGRGLQQWTHSYHSWVARVETIGLMTRNYVRCQRKLIRPAKVCQTQVFIISQSSQNSTFSCFRFLWSITLLLVSCRYCRFCLANCAWCSPTTKPTKNPLSYHYLSQKWLDGDVSIVSLLCMHSRKVSLP